MSKRLSHKHKVRLARRLMSQDERRTHCGLWDSKAWGRRVQSRLGGNTKVVSTHKPKKTFAESLEV